MNRLRIACWLMVLASGPLLAQGPHISTNPEGVQPAPPEGGGQVPCDVLVRYDDGTDDELGSGYTLGGPPGFNQRLGIIAQAPPDPTGGGWLIQSVGFYSEFWVSPGNLDFQVTSISNPANTTSETIFVDSGGIWEAPLTTPICVAGEEEFSLMLCPADGTWGVSGEDTSAPDGRSYWSTAACSPDNLLPNEDLMIWACVTPCVTQPTPLEVPALGRWGLAVLALVMAGIGSAWLFARRRA